MSLADVKTRIKMIAQISPLLGSTPSAVILCTFLCSGLVWPLSRPYLTHGTLPWSTNKKQSEGFKGKFYSNKAITTYKTELQTKALLRSSFSTGLCRCASPPQKKKKKMDSSSVQWWETIKVKRVNTYQVLSTPGTQYVFNKHEL